MAACLCLLELKGVLNTIKNGIHVCMVGLVEALKLCMLALPLTGPEVHHQEQKKWVLMTCDSLVCPRLATTPAWEKGHECQKLHDTEQIPNAV